MNGLKRIIIHWTAGTYTPNNVEKEHYHFLIEYIKEPKEIAVIRNGKFKPEDNLNCYDGKYAAHAGGGNTGSIGVAICAMLGFKDYRHIGNYPIKPIQMEVCYELCAKLCKEYQIPVKRDNIMTHYEFGRKNPQTSSKGKPDIMYLASNPSLPSNKIGDFIRGKILWYYKKLEAEAEGLSQYVC